MAVAEPSVAEPINGVESPDDDTAKSIHSTSNGSNGTTKHTRNVTDTDAQELVITSLRSQIQDLFTQVTQLNGKLVKSYNRVSDLEDDLHVASAQLRSSSLKISELELERTQHLAALNTGLLVEKSHVTAELNRLMEKATEEAAQRGQAESARVAIEQDLDDLSASLFNQANMMVAEARLGRARSERKVEEAEMALKGAEEAVSLMQHQMQVLQSEKEEADKRVENMQVSMGKGKWVDKLPERGALLARHTRLLSSHVAYQEFLFFVANLRTVRPASPHAPSIPSLLQLPFLARIASEDSDPTIRLDFAPALNWLSRRSVLAAIHAGQLTIEPLPSSTLLNDRGLVGSTSSGINCALCGTCIYASPEHLNPQRQSSLSSPSKNGIQSSVGGGWSTSLFKKPSNGLPISRSSSGPTSYQPPPAQIYIFRLSSSTPIPAVSATQTTTQYHHHPHTSSSSSFSSSTSTFSPNSPTLQSPGLISSPNPAAQSTTAIYPLCSNGWCLARLRTTCTMWAFIRTGIIEKVWEEEVPNVSMGVTPPATPKLSSSLVNGMGGQAQAQVNGTTSLNGGGESKPTATPPPIPPRRRTGLWGVAAALGEKAASWSESSEKKKAAASAAATAPPTPPKTNGVVNSTANATTAAAATPPPLPRRNEGRGRSGTVSAPPPGFGKRGSAPAPPMPTPPVPTSTSGSDSSAPPTRPSSAAANKGGAIIEEEEEEEEKPTEPSVASAAPTTASPATPPPRTSSPLASTPSKPTHTRTPSSPPPIHPSRTTSPPPVPQRALRHSAILTSAMNVPLPDSRPGTPNASGVPRERRMASPGRPQSPPARSDKRSGSPAGVGRAKSPVGGSVVGGAGPGPGPVPPPIPRRAAARIRPVSQTKEELVKATGGGESGEVKETKVKEEIQTPPPPPISADPSSEADSDVFVDAQEEGVGPQGIEHSNSGGSSKTTTVGGSGGGQGVEVNGSGGGGGLEEKTVVEEEVEGGSPRTSSIGDGDEHGHPKELNGIDEDTKVDVVGGVVGVGFGEEPEKEKETDMEKPKEEKEKDKEVYIGDATWEERTWKEVVRLKEEMFWARIGVGAVGEV